MIQFTHKDKLVEMSPSLSRALDTVVQSAKAGQYAVILHTKSREIKVVLTSTILDSDVLSKRIVPLLKVVV